MEEAPETVVDGAPSTIPSTRDDEAPVPLRVGRFFIFRRLGVGGMGEVLLGYDEELSRKLAIKLWRAQGEAEELRTRMRREAQALARLSHPNVVQVYEVGDHRGQLYLAMEYVEGETLREWVRAAKRPTAAIVERYVQAGRGLVAAHRAGILHRDFKPDNAIVGADGRVRVLDFGLARADSRGADEAPAGELDLGLPLKTDSLGASVTRAGSLLGTPAYMPPEQLSRESTDARADVYAFTASLWEALHGVRPYTGKTPLELLAAIHERRPREGEGRSIPGWLRAALLRGLAPEADERWPTMAALVATLEGGARRRRWRIGAALGIGAGALVLAGVAYSRAELAGRVAACEARGAEIAATWGEDQRAAVRAGLVASGLPHAPATADRVEAILNKYAETWSYAQVEACQHATIDGRWDPPTVAAADACLDELRGSLDGLGLALAGADAGAVTQAVEAASGLQPADLCVDAEALARRPRLPEDEAARAQAAALQRELGRALALAAAGRFADARKANDGLVERADALAWPPLQAKARFVAGSLGTSARHDAAGSEELLEDAFFRAVDGGDDPLAVRAAIRLVDLTGPGLMRVADAARWAGRGWPARSSLASAPSASSSRPTSSAARPTSPSSAATPGDRRPPTSAATPPGSPPWGPSTRSRPTPSSATRRWSASSATTPAPAISSSAASRPSSPRSARITRRSPARSPSSARSSSIPATTRRPTPRSSGRSPSIAATTATRASASPTTSSASAASGSAAAGSRSPAASSASRSISSRRGRRSARAGGRRPQRAGDRRSREAGDLDAALEHAEAAFEIFQGHVGGQHGGLAPALVELADIHTARGEPELAAPLIARARALIGDESDHELATSLVILGDLARAEGSGRRPRPTTRGRWRSARASTAPSTATSCGRSSASASSTSRPAASTRPARAPHPGARALAESPGPPADRGAVRFALARALAAAGEGAEAQALAELALADVGGLDERARGEVQRWLKGRRGGR
ncbi:MAG: serine/threonine protein kinase [Myxococcales bacterium]|nr:serine/threonine protein kinase [Myxococcales bacterium]